MKQPLYKRLLSYIKDVHILSTSSDHNEILDLLLVKGRYQLCTENAIYSYADKYDNFSTVFEKMDFQDCKDVLILGLGLASIPYMLENNFKRELRYTGVEIDDEIIFLASKYVLDDLKSDIEIINTDAYTYLCITDTKYDLICMDVFEDDKVPISLEEIDFVEMLRDSLADDGIVIYNRLATTNEDKAASKTFFNQVFKSVFPQAVIIETSGNYMLLSKSLSK